MRRCGRRCSMAACARSPCCCRRWSTCRRPTRHACWRAREELARLGLEIEAFGAGAVLVRALPAALGAPEPAPLLRDLADELAENWTRRRRWSRGSTR